MIEHIAKLEPRRTRELVAQQYRVTNGEKMEKEKLDANVEKLRNFSSVYNAEARIAPLGYLEVDLWQGRAVKF